RTVVAAAHAGERRRVVAGRVLGGAGRFEHRLEAGNRRGHLVHHRRPDADGDAIEEVAPRDRAVHAEGAFAGVVAILVVCHSLRPRSLDRGHAVISTACRCARLNSTQPSAVGPTTPTMSFVSNSGTL